MAVNVQQETEQFLSVLGHLLGFRKEANGQLLDNENATSEQRASSSNVENINVPLSKASVTGLWEAGSLTETVLELKMVSTGEAQRLKQKFQKPPQPSSTSIRKEPLVEPATKKPINSEPSNPKLGPPGPASFFPPRKVVVKADGDRNCPPNSSQSVVGNVAPGNRAAVAKTSSPHHIPTFDVGSSLFASIGSKSTSNKPAVSQSHQTRNGAVISPRLGNQPIDDSSSSQIKSNNNAFKTAHEQLQIDDKIKGIQRSLPPSTSNVHVSGLRRPPPKSDQAPPPSSSEKEPKPKFSENPEVEEIMSHESMSNIDPQMVEAILNEVVQTTSTTWNDIAGLEGVKAIIREVIIWPMRRPDIFTGLRASPRGILFFGPPGTGKTMFGRVIANQFNSTFFNISASSLTSKWIGDGEKMVRALFAVARVKQPSVIFIDEIDSILTQRSDTEHESSRRLKTEFLIQFDGCATQSEERILVIGVTNRPQELDEAARRRFVKRIYIPLPDFEGRKQLVRNLLKNYPTELSEDDFSTIAKMTEGYSGADMTSLCREAAYGPIREVGHLLDSIDANQVRSMQMKDFVTAQRQVKSSVATSDVFLYEEWDGKFGCHI